MSTIQDKLNLIKTNISKIRDSINSKYPQNVLSETDRLSTYPRFIDDIQSNTEISSIAFSKYSEEATYNQQFVKFNIITDGFWVIEENPDWIVVDRMTGYGNYELTLTLNTNNDNTQREGVVIVSLPYYVDKTLNPRRTFVITQKRSQASDISIGQYAMMTAKTAYNTNVIPTKNTKVEFSFNYIGNGTGFIGNFFGCTSKSGSSTDAYYFYIDNNSGALKGSFAGCADDLMGDKKDKKRTFLTNKATFTNAKVVMDSYKVTFECDEVSKTTLNDFTVEIDGTPARDKWTTSTTPLSILCRADRNNTQNLVAFTNAMTYNTEIQFINCKIYENDVLIRDYVPAFDLSYKACLYDKINNDFTYNEKNSGYGYLQPYSYNGSSSISLSKESFYCLNDYSDTLDVIGSNLSVTSSNWIDSSMSDDGKKVNFTVHSSDTNEYREGFITVKNGTSERTCAVMHCTNKDCTLLDSIVFRGSTRASIGCNNEYATFIDTGLKFSSDYNLIMYYTWLNNEDINKATVEIDICGARHGELSDSDLCFDPRRDRIIISNGDANFICYKVGTATDKLNTTPPYKMKFSYIAKKLQQNNSQWFDLNIKDDFMVTDRTFYIGGLHISDDKDGIKRTMACPRFALNRCIIADKKSAFLRLYLPVLVNNDEVANKPALLDVIHNVIYFNDGQPTMANGTTALDFGYIKLDGEQVNIGNPGENLSYKLRFEAKTNTTSNVSIIDATNNSVLAQGVGSVELVTTTINQTKARININGVNKDCVFPVSNYLYEKNGLFYDINDVQKK